MFEVERDKPPQPTWLDRALGFISPAWGARRVAFRMAAWNAEQLGYRSARRSRIDRAAGSTGSADYHLEQALDRRSMVDRCRQAERDNVLADGMLSRSVESVVGCGYRLQAQSASDRWNDRSERFWREWAEGEADVRGIASFDELLALWFRAYLRDGDIGTIKLDSGALQFVESDQISSPFGQFLTRGMVDGIELDKYGRHVAYHVVDEVDPINPATRYQKHRRIPAEAMIYEARRQRLGQTRGTPALANVIWLLEQIEGNVEAVTVAARMAASFGLVIVKHNEFAGLPTEVGSDGVARRKLTIEPGMFQRLRPGEDVKQIQPSQPTTNFPDFLATLGRLAGLSLGLPLEVAWLDFSRTNYSSARAALLQAWQTWRCYQRVCARFCSAVYKWKVTSWVAEGRLPAREDMFAHTWIKPGWRWLDPTKETEAIMAQLDAGLTTLSLEASKHGLEFDEIIAQRKREIEAMRAAGVPVYASNMSRDIGGEPTKRPALPPSDES